MKAKRVDKRTHQCFGSEPGTGSNVPTKISDPKHRRSWRDLPLRGRLMALAITGPTVHGRVAPIWKSESIPTSFIFRCNFLTH